MRESDLRDRLAENLSCLEPGLSLISKEYPLDAPVGTKGFIDILARDQTGMLVVIEIKRSDQAARSALHELFKYTGLFRAANGLGAHQVRCMLVSTTWRELRLPFSEFTRNCDFHVDGFELRVNDAGDITDVDRIVALDPAQPLSFCPEMLALFYTAREPRDRAVAAARDALEQLGLSDYVLLATEYRAQQPEVVFPFCCYIAVALLPRQARRRIRRRLGLDGPRESPIEEEQYAIARASEGLTVGAGSTAEAGSPAHLTQMLSGWEVSRVARFGRFLSPLSDDELLQVLRGFDGANPAAFRGAAMPRIAPAWAQLVRRVGRPLAHNLTWRRVVTAYLSEVKELRPSATATIAIWTPDSILATLWTCIEQGNDDDAPRLEIVVSDQNAVFLVVGSIVWDGQTRPTDPLVAGRELLVDDFPLSFMTMAQELDSAIMRRHGLSYVVDEVKFESPTPSPPHRLVMKASNLERQARPERSQGLTDFLSANAVYAETLRAVMRERIFVSRFAPE